MFEIIDVNKLPALDLHGESSDIAKILINDFINDNIKLKNNFIVIIHGKGMGILKRTTHEVLKNNKFVLKYKLYYYNDGMTLVELRR